MLSKSLPTTTDKTTDVTITRHLACCGRNLMCTAPLHVATNILDKAQKEHDCDEFPPTAPRLAHIVTGPPTLDPDATVD